MSSNGTIVFDLDGTLVDTVGDLIGTLNVVLGEIDCAPLPADDARGMIGHGARALIERGLSARGASVTKDELDRLHRRFLDHYEANIAVHSRPLDGLEDALDLLEAQGFRLAVLTNKLEHLAVKLLDALGLKERFAAIVGGDSFGFAKPDPRVFAATLERAGAAGSPAMMVGDSKTDLDTARNAGVSSILVTFGYTDIPVERLGADRLIRAWSELPPAVAALAGVLDFRRTATL